jgi:hypothetical protein
MILSPIICTCTARSWRNTTSPLFTSYRILPPLALKGSSTHKHHTQISKLYSAATYKRYSFKSLCSNSIGLSSVMHSVIAKKNGPQLTLSVWRETNIPPSRGIHCPIRCSFRCSNHATVLVHQILHFLFYVKNRRVRRYNFVIKPAISLQAPERFESNNNKTTFSVWHLYCTYGICCKEPHSSVAKIRLSRPLTLCEFYLWQR